jgi:O-acetyl-ADP-ribose deacetylase (regulator of RNase III)
MKITVKQGDITSISVDAIVNAANSYGYMGGGVAGAIKHIGGTEIEEDAVSQAPIPIGHAVITTAGSLKAKHVIHAPTMEQPAQLTDIGRVKEATQAALECADSNDLKVIAMPGMGTGVGRVPKDKAAQAIVSIIKMFKPYSLEEVILIDLGAEMVKEFEKALST